MSFACLKTSCRLVIAVATCVLLPVVVFAQGSSSCRFPGATFDVGDRPQAVAVGDLDSDLDLDIAVADASRMDSRFNKSLKIGS